MDYMVSAIDLIRLASIAMRDDVEPETASEIMDIVHRARTIKSARRASALAAEMPDHDLSALGLIGRNQVNNFPPRKSEGFA